MAYRIATELLERIAGEAAASPQVEICGLLFGAGGGTGVVTVEATEPCRNVAPDPATRFEIDPAALLAAYRRARAGGAAIVGCYHSHPSGSAVPSSCDAAAAEANGWLWLIVGGGTVRGWLAGEGGLHGRFEEMPLAPVIRAEADIIVPYDRP